MSGHYGWGGNDNYSSSNSGGSSSRHYDDDNTGYGGYSNNKPVTQQINKTAVRSNTYANPYYGGTAATQSRVVDTTPNVDVSIKNVSSTKENVILIGLDVTGSMREWIPEIFKFLPLLHAEASLMLSGETEILFASFGDGEHGDKLLTAPFGSDKTLDSYLTAVRTSANGGGNYVETPESFLYYVDKYVDLTASKQVFTFVVTDEGIKKNFSARSWELMTGASFIGEEFLNSELIRRLRLKTDIATIFSSSNAYYANDVANMRKSWTEILPEGSLLEMARANLVVETMLAFIAARVNKMDVFKTQYADRRGGTQYGQENLNTVLRSVSLVPPVGGISPTKNIAPGTKSLTAALGTKSLVTSGIKNIAPTQINKSALITSGTEDSVMNGATKALFSKK